MDTGGDGMLSLLLNALGFLILLAFALLGG